MEAKQFIFKLFTLALLLSGLALPVKASDYPAYLTSGVKGLADSDLDGVDDVNDLCPGTPTGVAVNAYGCPLALVTCDYSTSAVTLNSTGGSSGTSVTTQYVLADHTGLIVQISPIATFSTLTGTQTYMALALTYDGNPTGLSVGNPLSAVSASCFDWSDALMFKACVAPASTCDYRVGDVVTLKTAGGSTGAGVRTSYVLTDAAGILIQVASTPTFNTAGLNIGDYKAYALTYNDDSSITNLLANGENTIGGVTGNCLVLSEALPLTLCSCAPVCIPILIERMR